MNNNNLKKLENFINFTQKNKSAHWKSYLNSKSDHFMTMEYSRTISKNSSFSYKNEINLNGNYKSYIEEFKLSFADECQKINLNYLIDNYNDGKRMKLNKKISLKYEMDF